MTRPNSLPLPPPPCGVQMCFFLCVFVFLFSLVFNQETQKSKKKNDKTQLSATTPLLGVCNLGFCVFVF